MVIMVTLQRKVKCYRMVFPFAPIMHPSDVLIGAAVGLVAGSFLLHRVQQWGWIEPVVEQDQPLVSVPVSPLPVQQQPVPDHEIAKAS